MSTRFGTAPRSKRRQIFTTDWRALNLVGLASMRGWTWTIVATTMPCLAAVACTSGPPPPVDSRPYEDQVVASRAAKDTYLRTDRESPIPVEARLAFSGLPYYPIDRTYRVPAAFTETRSNPPVVIELPNSAHELERKVKAGSLAFTLAGTSYALSAFAENSGNTQRLWVPFRDLTSGVETYGGGRYLDIDRTATGLYDLDFNRAYHPTCVYAPDWVCPYPPSENRLPAAIRAGERLPDAGRTK